MITIALVNPEIPPNTGNIARLCGATGLSLHIIGKPNFDTSNKALKRAGLDYWHLLDVHYFEDVETYFNDSKKNTFFFSTKGKQSYIYSPFSKDCTLVFGSETKGLPTWIHTKFSENIYTIPMANKEKGMRSINLAVSCGIVAYECLRQNGALEAPVIQ